MTTPTLRAIKCSERMPTRDDGDRHGWVLWIVNDELGGKDAEAGSFKNPRRNDFDATHWLPLSAIAIDAEEQRGEGGA